LAGEQLALLATVYDHKITPLSTVWSATSVKFYCSLPGSTTVRQVDICPAGTHGEGQVMLYENGRGLPAASLQWHAEPRADYGYQLTALIPLSALQVTRTKPFLFDYAVLVAPEPDGHPLAADLFSNPKDAAKLNAKFGLAAPHRRIGR
jgi:hypothetical protein